MFGPVSSRISRTSALLMQDGQPGMGNKGTLASAESYVGVREDAPGAADAQQTMIGDAGGLLFPDFPAFDFGRLYPRQLVARKLAAPDADLLLHSLDQPPQPTAF